MDCQLATPKEGKVNEVPFSCCFALKNEGSRQGVYRGCNQRETGICSVVNSDWNCWEIFFHLTWCSVIFFKKKSSWFVFGSHFEISGESSRLLVSPGRLNLTPYLMAISHSYLLPLANHLLFTPQKSVTSPENSWVDAMNCTGAKAQPQSASLSTDLQKQLEMPWELLLRQRLEWLAHSLVYA